MKIFVSRPGDLGAVRKAVIEAVESGAIDAQVLQKSPTNAS
jgi:hypothetical protein